MPESSVDPVVMAASTVLRLQTIVSREVAASQAAVVTVGALQAGTKDNVIPDEALLKINVRTFDEAVRTRVLGAIERIVKAEAAASGAPKPPQIDYTEHYPLTVNDPDQTRHVADALRGYFGSDRVSELAAPVSASEDFGSFGTEWRVPSVFWYIGGTDPRRLPQSRASRSRRRRHPDQPQPEVRPRHPSDARDRRAGDHHSGAQLPRPERLTEPPTRLGGEAANEAAQQAARDAARQLHGAGLPLRHVGEVLGVSHHGADHLVCSR